MSLRDWIISQLDNLMATVFIAVVIAALVGFYKRSTGMAIFTSCASSTVLALLSYLVGNSWGYDWRLLIPVLGVGAGMCSVALFKVAIKFSDRLEARDQEIADKLINKGLNAIPGDGGVDT